MDPLRDQRVSINTISPGLCVLAFQIVSNFGEWSELGSRDIDGQTGEGERAGENESIELKRLGGLPQSSRGNERDGRSRSPRRLSFVGTSESMEFAGADDMDGKPEG